MHVILWKISVVALLLGNSLDSASSFRHPELNPILATNGRFGGKGIAIKTGAVGGIIILLHRHPKAGAAVNFGAAGLFTGIAVRNWRMK